VHLPDADMSVLADTHDHHHSVDVRLDIRAALEQLPEGQRMALTLVDMHGLKIAEAASILNVAEGTVKSRCARGRAAMAPLLGLAPAFETSIAPARKEPNASP
jgi:RNA polymerase sigma-70 factor (ECF subfamily)